MLAEIGSLWWLWLSISVGCSMFYYGLIGLAERTVGNPKSPILLMVGTALTSWVIANTVGLLFWFSILIQLIKGFKALYG